MTPTWHEKYLKGMEMERAGSGSAEIAAALGFKDKRGWYNTKAYFKNKALTERAAVQAPDNPEPAAILEGVKVEHVPVPQKAPLHATRTLEGQDVITAAADARTFSINDLPPKRLRIQREASAAGALMNYRFADGKLSFRPRAGKANAVVMDISQVTEMIAEIVELLREVKEDA